MIALPSITRTPNGSFWKVLLLGILVGAGALAGAWVLCESVLIPLASACLQACAQDPILMHIARGGASLAVAAVASGLLVGLVVLGSQIRSTRELVRRVESQAVSPTLRLARLAQELGIAGRLTYVLDPAAYAFCYGFLSPRICVSSGMARSLSATELRAVLLHETFHLRQRDPVKVLVSRMVAGALYLLPVAAELRDRYLLEKELSADAYVVERLTPQPLAGALLKIWRSSAQRPVADLAAAAVGPFDVFGERVRHLSRPSLRPAPIARWKMVASVAVAAMLVAATVGSSYAAERSAPAGAACCNLSGGNCNSSGVGSLSQEH